MSPTAYPLVSVVIPFYNCPFVAHSIESVLQQTYPHIEIIVVDDGSTVHTDQIEPYRHRIRYLRKSNGGTATALNEGFRAAKGEYIVWQSSDDMMVPHKIAVQAAYMQQHQAPISCTDFHVVDQYNNYLTTYCAVKFPTAKAFIKALLDYCPINGSTIMMHRSLPRKIGWFDESIILAHDYEYWIRVHLARIDFHYINEAMTLYRWHDGMGTQRKQEQAAVEFKRVRDLYAPHLQKLLSRLPGH